MKKLSVSLFCGLILLRCLYFYTPVLFLFMLSLLVGTAKQISQAHRTPMKTYVMMKSCNKAMIIMCWNCFLAELLLSNLLKTDAKNLLSGFQQTGQVIDQLDFIGKEFPISLDLLKDFHFSSPYGVAKPD